MKLLRKLLGQLLSPLSLGLLIALGFSLFAASYYAVPERFELTSKANQFFYDLRMESRGPRPGHPDIAILAIDDRSLLQEGRWPWPRQKMAELVKRAMENGARMIAFDMVFSEEDPNSARPALLEVQSKLADKKMSSTAVTAILDQQILSADSDDVLGKTIGKNADSLVMGALFEESHDLSQFSPTTELCYNMLAWNTSADTYWKRDEILILTPVELKLPEPLLEHYHSYFTTVLEPSSVNRWFKTNEVTKILVEALVSKVGEPLNQDNIEPLLVYYSAGKLSQYGELLSIPANKLSEIRKGLDEIFNPSRSASLAAQIYEEKKKYCERFLGPRDELLSQKAFDTIYDKPELYEYFGLDKNWAELQKKSNDLAALELNAYIQKLKNESTHSHITGTDFWRVNIPKIAQHTRHSGYFNTSLDNDGVIRSGALLTKYGEIYVPSLTMKSIAVLSETIPTVEWREKQTQYFDGPTGKMATRLERYPASLKLRSSEDENIFLLDLPIDRYSKMLINYSGGQHSFPHLSAADLLSEEATIEVTDLDSNTKSRQPKAEALKDKILLLGPTAVAVFDMRVTPFEENYPGVETHANLLSNLLIEYQRQNNKLPTGKDTSQVPGFVKKVSREPLLMPIALLILGAIVAFAISYFGSIAGLLLTVAILIVILAIDKFVFFERGFAINAVFPIFLTVLQYVILTFHKYFTEERKKRELKGVFEKYVSPSIVAEVLSHPENLELGGRKQDLTVMFSDVRGFTTISEKLDPRELSALLSNYLTPMTQLVFKNKGTLDKYMGDAIMAFFGAPVKFPDHAKWACRCALEMLVKLKELQAIFKSQGLPEIDIGIGLNTGEVSVGNMGSDTVQSYTVMGDAVNLGSRLEGINKEYGTRIVISEFTQKALGAEFATRELDWVKVKGKLLPVKIFELVGEGQIPEQTKLTLGAFAEGFSFYHKQQWSEAITAFEKALSHTPNDPPSELYLERCREYLIHPPPGDWDGVFTMTTK